KVAGTARPSRCSTTSRVRRLRLLWLSIGSYLEARTHDPADTSHPSRPRPASGTGDAVPPLWGEESGTRARSATKNFGIGATASADRGAARTDNAKSFILTA